MSEIQLKDKIYHVHTYRCGHASDESEEDYIKKAIDAGAKELSFSDHAPIPGDPFDYQMHMDELPGYVSTLTALREKYSDRISIRIGLEAEYLPGLDTYFRELKGKYGLDFLLLGQHIFEDENGEYSFFYDIEKKRALDTKGLAGGMLAGIESGIFEAVAHPDRIFRRKTVWDDEMSEISEKVIAAAMKQGIPLEKNMESRKIPHLYWPEFWRMVPPECGIIYGVDAHSSKEMTDGYAMIKRIIAGEIE